MQGKEASEQETGKSNAGIDVSKSWLDVHVVPAGATLRVANTRDGIRKLKRWLTRFDLALLVIEATGKWHRDVRRSLHAAAIPVAVVDPFRVRMFAKACGILAKTDRLDARVLAQFAAVMAPAVRAPMPQAMEELAELVTARASAVAEETALKNQLSAAISPFLKRQLGRRLERQGHRRPSRPRSSGAFAPTKGWPGVTTYSPRSPASVRSSLQPSLPAWPNSAPAAASRSACWPALLQLLTNPASAKASGSCGVAGPMCGASSISPPSPQPASMPI